jgi:hypothetical protein
LGYLVFLPIIEYYIFQKHHDISFLYNKLYINVTEMSNIMNNFSVNFNKQICLIRLTLHLVPVIMCSTH